MLCLRLRGVVTCDSAKERAVQRDARKLSPPATATVTGTARRHKGANSAEGCKKTAPSCNSDRLSDDCPLQQQRREGEEGQRSANTCSAVLLPDLHRCQTMDSDSTVIGEIPFHCSALVLCGERLGLGIFSQGSCASSRRNEFPQSRVSRMLVYHVVLKVVVQIYKYCCVQCGTKFAPGLPSRS